MNRKKLKQKKNRVDSPARQPPSPWSGLLSKRAAPLYNSSSGAGTPTPPTPRSSKLNPILARVHVGGSRRWWGRRKAARRGRCGGGWTPPAGAWSWTAGWPRSSRPTAPTSTTRSGAPSASSPPRTSSARQARPPARDPP
jgi:hypothetical protein